MTVEIGSTLIETSSQYFNGLAVVSRLATNQLLV